MVKRLILILVAFSLCAGNASGQADTVTRKSSCAPDAFWCLGGGVVLEPTLIQPNSRIYFDEGVDDTAEVDLFRDGRLTVGIQLIGFDVSRRFNRNRMRFGVNVGAGITSTADTVQAAVLMWNLDLFAEFAGIFRIEGGLMTGYAAREGSGNNDDTAVFFGIGLTSVMGNVLKRVLREGEPVQFVPPPSPPPPPPQASRGSGSVP